MANYSPSVKQQSETLWLFYGIISVELLFITAIIGKDDLLLKGIFYCIGMILMTISILSYRKANLQKHQSLQQLIPTSRLTSLRSVEQTLLIMSSMSAFTAYTAFILFHEVTMKVIMPSIFAAIFFAGKKLLSKLAEKEERENNPEIYSAHMQEKYGEEQYSGFFLHNGMQWVDFLEQIHAQGFRVGQITEHPHPFYSTKKYVFLVAYHPEYKLLLTAYGGLLQPDGTYATSNIQIAGVIQPKDKSHLLELLKKYDGDYYERVHGRIEFTHAHPDDTFEVIWAILKSGSTFVNWNMRHFRMFHNPEDLEQLLTKLPDDLKEFLIGSNRSQQQAPNGGESH